MKNRTGIGILLLSFLIILNSCQKSGPIGDDFLKIESTEEEEILIGMGFSKDKIENYPTYFLVEGCYIFFKEDLKDNETSKLKASGKKSQYVRSLSQKVSEGNRNIKIYVDGSIPTSGVDNWRSALSKAVNSYNSIPNLNLSLQQVTSATTADIIIQSDLSIQLPSTSYAAAEYPQSNGKPGRNLFINLDFNNNETVSEGGKHHILVHELGHSIGFRHTDLLGTDSPKQLIPGTPTVDYNSVMNSTYSHTLGWGGFSTYDVIALNYLYQQTLNVSIDGPRKASNSGTYTWTAMSHNGTAPYTYEWSYKRSSSQTWTSTVSTNQSLTMPMPLNESLGLRVTVSDANGVLGTETISVLNLTVNHP